MYAPDCPDHGRLVLDLALGKLDDAAATRAEIVRSQCPICRAWWREQLEGDTSDVVDNAVAAALSTVDLPDRRHRRAWLAVAAAAVVVVGIGALWLGRQPTSPPAPATADAGMIRSLSFEDPAEVAPLIHSEAPAETPAEPTTVRPAPDHAAPTRIAASTNVMPERPVVKGPVDDAAADDQPLSADGFESGDLSAWNPHA